MKELQFVASRRGDWDLWDRWLGLVDTRAAPARSWRLRFSRREPDSIVAAELASRFRALCHDLSLARDRNYSSLLVDRLQTRVLLAHQRLYGARRGAGAALRNFLNFGFPVAVRREWRVVLVAALLFFGPLVALTFALQWKPSGVYLFLNADAVSEMERLYGHDTAYAQQFMGGAKDWARYAGYIANNVRIDFQCFATGLAFCLGSVFYLIFNGVTIGAVAGYLTEVGLGENFWSFVSGHSGFELTGVVLSGAAGLKLGMALVAPGRQTRAAALLASARDAAPLIYGAALLTFFAASIEAFWSPVRSVPPLVKYGVGIGLWTILLLYLGLARAPRQTPTRSTP